VQASGVNLQDVLRDEGRGASSFRLGRASRALVAAQIGFSCALLIVAGLMIKGVLVMSRTSGYEPERIAVGRYELRSPRYERTQLATFHRDMIDRVSRIPGVRSAAATSHLPGMGTEWRSIEVEGMQYAADAWPEVHTALVSPGYFATAGAGTVLRGRDFSWSDDDDQPRVAVVNVAFAHRFFGGDEPIGRRFRVRRGIVDPGPWTTIVGLVPNVGIRTGAGESEDAMYLPLTQHPPRSVALMLQTMGDPAVLLPDLRAAVHDVDPELAVHDVGRLDRVIRDARITERVFGILFASFGAAALLLAMIGLYGTVAFSVSRRTREFGIRAALGARPRDVLLLTIRGNASYIGAGAAAGVLLAMAVAPFFDYALFGISPRDPLVYTGVIAMLAVTALCAVLVPATRAAWTPPTAALLDADG
jgi:putative ABC transport system permease protein